MSLMIVVLVVVQLILMVDVMIESLCGQQQTTDPDRDKC